MPLQSLQKEANFASMHLTGQSSDCIGVCCKWLGFYNITEMIKAPRAENLTGSCKTSLGVGN